MTSYLSLVFVNEKPVAIVIWSALDLPAFSTTWYLLWPLLPATKASQDFTGDRYLISKCPNGFFICLLLLDLNFETTFEGQLRTSIAAELVISVMAVFNLAHLWNYVFTVEPQL